MDGDPIFGLPPRNKARAPLENNPAPHVLRMLDPERMFRKSKDFLLLKTGFSTCLILVKSFEHGLNYDVDVSIIGPMLNM